jgi:hypothetical protein
MTSSSNGPSLRPFLLLAALLAFGCGEDRPSGPAPVPWARCAELSDSLFPKPDRNGIAAFKVVVPETGSFQVGKEMRVVVAGADYTSALVDLVVSGTAGGVGRIPGFPANNGIKPHETCEWRFPVPDSIYTVTPPIRKISLVSDSVRIKVTDYSDGLSFDYSGFFSIKP